MAWDEWEQLKSAAAERSSPLGMQLNGLPKPAPGQGAAGGDLVVHQDDLGAIGHEAFVLHGDLRKKADIAGMGMNGEGAGSTMQAATELGGRNFSMGDALSTTVETWTSQVKSLLQACAHISNHLAYSKKLHSRDDTLIAASIRGRDGSALPVSQLNKYFK